MTARLRARFSPATGSSTTRSHGMRSVHAVANARVPSVDPLSTSTTSHGAPKSWRVSAASWRVSVRNARLTGVR